MSFHSFPLAATVTQAAGPTAAGGKSQDGDAVSSCACADRK